jgi:hypothetical protein
MGPNGTYFSSPVAGDGKVSVASETGTIVVVKDGNRLASL